jgi:hypothetical protein
VCVFSVSSWELLIGVVTSGSGSSSCVIASVGDRVIKEVGWGMGV